MIATHNEKGIVKPVRFRSNFDGELKAFDVKVKVATETKIEKNRILTFVCEIQDGDFMKPCELRFYVNNTYWTLFKI